MLNNIKSSEIKHPVIILSLALILWSIYFYVNNIFSSNILTSLFILLLIIINLIVICFNKFYLKKEEFILPSKIDFFILLIFLIILLIINMQFLNMEIPIRGDEGYHFARANKFYNRLLFNIAKHKYLLFILPIIFLFSIISSLILLKYILKINKTHKLILSFSIAFCITSLIFSLFMIKKYIHPRYPPLIAFIQGLLFQINPLTKYSEFANRMMTFIPMILTILILNICMINLNIKRIYVILITLIYSFMPLIFYHYITIYLEPLMILLLSTGSLLIILNLYKGKEVVSRKLISFIIGISGFCKESTFPILSAFFLLFIIIEFIQNKEKPVKDKLISLTSDFILIFLPVLFYLLLRMSVVISSDVRSHALNFSLLINPTLYRYYFKAVIYQLNPLIFIMIIFTLIYSIIKRKFIYENILAMLIVILNFLFFATDHLEFNGYSRFNLGFIPAVMIYFVVFAIIINDIKIKGLKILTITFCILTILINLYLIPVTIDKRKDWGTPGWDSGFNYYPFNSLCKWMKANDIKILYYNPYYNFNIEFYGIKHNVDFKELEKKINNQEELYNIAVKNGYDYILIQPYTDYGELFKINNYNLFYIYKIFHRYGNQLTVYKIKK